MISDPIIGGPKKIGASVNSAAISVIANANATASQVPRKQESQKAGRRNMEREGDNSLDADSDKCGTFGPLPVSIFEHQDEDR